MVQLVLSEILSYSVKGLTEWICMMDNILICSYNALQLWKVLILGKYSLFLWSELFFLIRATFHNNVIDRITEMCIIKIKVRAPLSTWQADGSRCSCSISRPACWHPKFNPEVTCGWNGKKTLCLYYLWAVLKIVEQRWIFACSLNAPCTWI